MKKILLVIPAACMFTFCRTSKAGHDTTSTANSSASASTASNEINSFRSKRIVDTLSTDTVIITGTQYMPIEGRSETGTRADLEGAWVLDSLNGTAIPGRSNINVEALNKQIADSGGDIRHDSTTSTETINGVTHTTTTVLVDRMGTPGNKITPPQGATYHIPAKPSISFFGANETFSGFTGCNRFSGRYSVTGKNTISLQGAAASTKMVCLGDYDEEAFLNTLRRVNAFKAVNGELELLEGTNVLLSFSKKQQ